MAMSGEEVNISKVVVVAHFKDLSRNLSGGTTEVACHGKEL
jgi:hypothetical protein